MIIKSLAVIVLATFASTFPLKPEYDGDMSPEYSGGPMARNDSDSNEDDRVEEYFADLLEDDFENETLSEQWSENTDNSSSSFLPDLTIWDDADSNEDDHLQKSFTNPPTDENEDVSSSSLRPENDSLQESFTNSQKDENEDLTSSTPMPKNDGTREPKRIPIPKADFTLEELKEMLEAKLNEDRRILDANKRKFENDHPQESLENPQKDENEEVIPSPPWPENDGLASRLEDAPTVSDDYEYVDVECFEEDCEEDIEKEVLDKPLQILKKTITKSNSGLVFGLSAGAALVAFVVLFYLCNKCLNCKQGKNKTDNNPDSIDEAQVKNQIETDNQIRETVETAEKELQEQIDSVENDTELPKEEKQNKIEALEDQKTNLKMKFEEYKETAAQSSKNLKKANSSGYGRQSTNNVSIGSVALAELKLAEEGLNDNNGEGDGANAEAAGPSDNCNSLSRMRSGCAKKIYKRHSVESGIGDSPSDSLRTLSSSRPTSPDEAFCEDETSTNSSFVRNSPMRRTKSTPNVSKGNHSLQRAAIANDFTIRRQTMYHNPMTAVAEVHEMTPEMQRKNQEKFSVAFTKNQI